MSLPTLLVPAWPARSWQEIAPTLSLLARTHEVRVVASGPDPVRVLEGYQILPDLVWADVRPGGLLLVPGGELEAAWDDPVLLEGLRQAAATAPRIGAICNGVILLARAGLAVGRHITHAVVAPYTTRPKWSALLDFVEPHLGDTHYVDADVVVDPGAPELVTARPWAALRFARTMATPHRPDAAAAARYLGGARDLPDVDPYERWVITLTRVPDTETTAAHISAHIAWLRALEADGRLVMAGPLPDDAAGQVVLRVRDRAEAEAIRDADPFVVAGVRAPVLRRWLLSCEENGHMGRG